MNFREFYYQPESPPKHLCPVGKTDLEASQEFYDCMKTRRSIRQFSSRPVEQELLLNAIKTAATAPSGANGQPWFFALITSQDLKIKIREEAERVETMFYRRSATQKFLVDLAPLGTDEHKPYLSEAAALILVFTRKENTNEKTYYPVESTGIAVGLLLSSLHLSGLSTLVHTPRPMSFSNELLGLDSSLRPYMLIVAGHASEGVVVPKIEKKEMNEILKIY
jgi:iodotyrosine deiodinase